MLRCIFGHQQALEQLWGQAASGWARQNAEEGTAGWNPGQRVLQDRNSKPPLDQVAGRESGEGPISTEVSTEQCTGGIEAGLIQCALEQPRREVDYGDGLADEGQRRGYRLERRRVAGQS